MGSGQSHQVQPHTGNSPEIKRWDTGQPRDSSQPTSSRRQAPPASHDVKQYGVKSHDVSKAMSVASVSEDGNDYSIFEYVANNIVGKDVVLDGPFGHKKGKNCGCQTCKCPELLPKVNVSLGLGTSVWVWAVLGGKCSDTLGVILAKV